MVFRLAPLLAAMTLLAGCTGWCEFCFEDDYYDDYYDGCYDCYDGCYDCYYDCYDPYCGCDVCLYASYLKTLPDEEALSAEQAAVESEFNAAAAAGTDATDAGARLAVLETFRTPPG